MDNNKKIKIYHNPRCSKSRETLLLLMSQTSEIEIIDYLQNPIKFDELKEIIEKLKITPHQLVRKDEIIWKKKYKKKKLSDKEIIIAMIENIELIQRPIVITNKKGIIGRPPENVLSLFNYEGI